MRAPVLFASSGSNDYITAVRRWKKPIGIADPNQGAVRGDVPRL